MGGDSIRICIKKKKQSTKKFKTIGEVSLSLDDVLQQPFDGMVILYYPKEWRPVCDLISSLME
jgi:hypothetical protein